MNKTRADEIVSKVGQTYADLNDRGQLVKPHSALPCSLFAVREAFQTAYEVELNQLSEEIKDSFAYVYKELAFFVDDSLCDSFNASLTVAVQHRRERLRAIGVEEDEMFSRNCIASDTVKIQDRKSIWEHLGHEETCPTRDLLLIAETLAYCGEMYRVLWNEWAAFANLTEYRNKSQCRT